MKSRSTLLDFASPIFPEIWITIAGGDVGSRVRTYIRSLVLRDMDRGGFSLGGVDMFDLGRSMRGGKKVVISFFL